MIKRRKISQPKRQGAAVVEFAVCLPLIALIVIGSLEASNLLFLKQTLVQAAYEGVKVAIATGDTEKVEAVIEAVAAGRNLQGVEIEFTPTDIANLPPGEQLTIKVTAPGDSNSVLPFGPFKNIVVGTSASMIRE